MLVTNVTTSQIVCELACPCKEGNRLRWLCGLNQPANPAAEQLLLGSAALLPGMVFKRHLLIAVILQPLASLRARQRRLRARALS